jgi:hypothetical protein
MRDERDALVFVFPSPNFEEIGGGAALAAEGVGLFFDFCLGIISLL